MSVKSILSLGLTGQSLALAVGNLGLAKSKKKTPGKIIKTGISNIVSINLIRSQGGLISKL